MRKLGFAAAVGLALTAGASAAPRPQAAGQVFVQGAMAPFLIVMEAEHAGTNTPLIGNDWVSRTTEPTGQTNTFSGTGYMQAESPMTGAAQAWETPALYLANSPRLDFRVQFSQAAVHYVWVRAWGVDTAHNSLHIGYNGAGTGGSLNCDRISVNVPAPGTDWTWTRARAGATAMGDPVFTSTAGVHTINVWVREDGVAVDKILISTDPMYTPTDLEPESTEAPDPTPATPTGLTAVAGDGQVSLNWNDVGTSTYEVFRGTSAGTVTTPSGTPATSDQVVTGLTNGTQYFFTVRAVNSFGTSAPTAPVSATPIPPQPGQPVVTATAGNGQVSLSWPPAAGASFYRVYQSTTPGQLGTLIADNLTATSLLVSPLADFTTYYFTVRAVNANPQTTDSVQVSATPMPRTNDHDEGLFDGKCALGSAGPAGGAALLFMAAVALLGRRAGQK